MKPFLFETTDMIDTNPKKYIGPPVDPKTGKFKCSKHGKEDSCFDDTEVHTKEIPDEKVFFKPKEKKSMKENDSLFNDEDFEILEADHKRYPEGSMAQAMAQRDSNAKKREHKGFSSNKTKANAYSAGRFGRIANSTDQPISKIGGVMTANKALDASPNRPKKKGDIEILTRGAVKEAVVSEADHKKYPEGSVAKRNAIHKAKERKRAHHGLSTGDPNDPNDLTGVPNTKTLVKDASTYGRLALNMDSEDVRGIHSRGLSAGASIAAQYSSPKRLRKKGDVETLTRGAVKESRSFNDFLNRDIEESETSVPQEKKFDHNSAILKWELEAVGIRTKNAPIVENPTPKIDYDEVAKSIFEKHKAKEVPVTIPTKFQEAIEKREKGNATLTKAFYDEYK